MTTINIIRTWPHALLLAAALTALCIVAPVRGSAREDNPPCPGAVADACADLGNTNDEKHHELEGWGSASSDARYQTLRGENGLTLFIEKPNTPSDLIAETEDGNYDDSFEILVNGLSVYTYKSDPGNYTAARHQVLIPAKAIPGKAVRIVFRNQSTDSCGLAAVFYVRLIPRPT